MAELLGDLQLVCKSKLVPQTTLSSAIDQVEHTNTTIVANETLKDKVVCLFFSASWCTPCQHFVPLLKEVYTELKRRGSLLEIIFLSFDKTEEEMMNYYNEKHGDWLAIKFGDPVKEKLAEQYGISVIPKLIVIQPDGELITSKGRKDIQDKGLVCMRAWQAGFTKHVSVSSEKGENMNDPLSQDQIQNEPMSDQ